MENSKKFAGIIGLSIVIEALITYGNEIFAPGDIHWKMIASIVIGVGIAIAYKVDILELTGLVSNVPYIGFILSGILMSRGSNYIFDLISKLSELG